MSRGMGHSDKLTNNAKYIVPNEEPQLMLSLSTAKAAAAIKWSCMITYQGLEVGRNKQVRLILTSKFLCILLKGSHANFFVSFILGFIYTCVFFKNLKLSVVLFEKHTGANKF